MSKLTHSTDEGMRKVDERHAREDGEIQLGNPNADKHAPMVLKDLVAMARAAEKDERLSDGPLYGKLADEIERLSSAIYFWAICRYPENPPAASDITGRVRLQQATDHAESTMLRIYEEYRLDAACRDYMRDGIDSDTAEMMDAVDKRHKRLADFTHQFMAEGFSNSEANRRAFMMVKAGLKPKVDGTEYRAREDGEAPQVDGPPTCHVCGKPAVGMVCEASRDADDPRHRVILGR